VRTCDTSDGRAGFAIDDLDAAAPPLGAPYVDKQKSAAAQNGTFLTLYLLPPSAGAATFQLQMDAMHQAVLRTQTVKWADIALPQPPAAS
jgi:hypothetical protein